LLERARLVRLDFSPFLLGVGTVERSRVSCTRASKVEGGVVADPSHGVRPVLLDSVEPRLLRPSLADVTWAAWLAN
jgi:hypothetical protein